MTSPVSSLPALARPSTPAPAPVPTPTGPAPTHAAEPPARTAARALAWLGGAALVVLAALALRGPSETLYVAVVSRTGDLAGSALVSEAGVVLLLVLCALLFLRARHDGVAAVATTLTAGVGAVLAYGASEAVKSLVRQPRGCWELVEVAHCPPAGDWSFPSNHTAIAVALATAVVLVGAPGVRAFGARPPRHAATVRPSDVALRVVLPVGVAVLVAGARVTQGAHYPHDVVAGAALGVGVVVATVLLLAGPATDVVHAACRSDVARRLLVVSPAR
ncbi:phosphatase PAP2 family protein [Cellulosimicrobium marinum]|uniref:phosphatase PAP2 family protein n=1 Tax=Cellulosimicrobium marinum TaxID=1638992 RepID=UPI001E5FB914|nr:phosphatase PAP2 family protein [Cellulosimicrobium marinum]MCB7137106.1 phosphatase PAP2 family protein [Cellulosimicrobium marinum]